MNRRGFLAASASLVAAGCTAPGEKDSVGTDGTTEENTEPTVEWDAGRFRRDLEPGDEPIVEAASAYRDELIVGGVARLPDPCHELRMDDWVYDSAGRTIEVRLEAVDMSPPSEACADVIKYEEYAFLIHDADGVDRVVIAEPFDDRHRLVLSEE